MGLGVIFCSHHPDSNLSQQHDRNHEVLVCFFLNFCTLGGVVDQKRSLQIPFNLTSGVVSTIDVLSIQ